MPSPLLAQVSHATAGEYDVLAELGEGQGGAAFLAREVASGALMVLSLPPAADELAVLSALGENVPASAGRCTTCGVAPAVWTAACPGCGHALVGSGATATLEEVRGATSHAYEVLGQLPHQNGGALFLARDRADARLVALAAVTAPTGESLLQAVWEEPGSAVPTPPIGQTGQPTVGPTSTDPDSTAYEGQGYAPPPPASGRRWGPLVGGVLGMAVLAGGAWALLGRDGRESTGPAGQPVGAVAGAGAALGDSAGGTLGNSGVAPDTAAGAAGGGAAGGAGAVGTAGVTPPVTPPPGTADSTAPRPDRLARPHVVTIEGELPPGWTRTVNGGATSSSRTVRVLRPGPVVIRLQAPGYCPDAFRFTPVPGGADRWTPALRGAPMVGSC